MKKRLLVTSTDLMMVQFLVPHIIHLSENGYDVDIACSNVGGRIEEIQQKLQGYVQNIHVVRLVRSPVNPVNIKGYRDMKKLLQNNRYDIIWTNEPVMGVVTRLATMKTRKAGTKVLYMAHGFHFFDGAPKLNWLIYYPVEKMMSRHTDVLVTINQEDFDRAKRMHTQSVKYIHGIGVNTERLQKGDEQKDIRCELGIPRESFLVVSVGELNENKNQKVILRALGMLKDQGIHYILCGKGDMLHQLQLVAKQENVQDNVHFLGYRNDVVDICSQADVFAFPTYREGLGLAALEAMYCGLPLVTSNSRGPVDFMEEDVTGFICLPDDAKGFADAIAALKEDSGLRQKIGLNNKKIVEPFCMEQVKEEVLDLINYISYN